LKENREGQPVPAFVLKMIKMSEIDFNKLIKDIINAAREEANTDLNRVRSGSEDNKLSITLKLEVAISGNSKQSYPDSQKSSRRLVLLTIDDRE